MLREIAKSAIFSISGITTLALCLWIIIPIVDFFQYSDSDLSVEELNSEYPLADLVREGNTSTEGEAIASTLPTAAANTAPSQGIEDDFLEMYFKHCADVPINKLEIVAFHLKRRGTLIDKKKITLGGGLGELDLHYYKGTNTLVQNSGYVYGGDPLGSGTKGLHPIIDVIKNGIQVCSFRYETGKRENLLTGVLLLVTWDSNGRATGSTGGMFYHWEKGILRERKFMDVKELTQ